MFAVQRRYQLLPQHFPFFISFFRNRFSYQLTLVVEAGLGDVLDVLNYRFSHALEDQIDVGSIKGTGLEEWNLESISDRFS